MLAIMGTEPKKKKNLKDLTVSEIKAQLDKFGVKYDKKATKDDLLTLLPQKG